MEEELFVINKELASRIVITLKQIKPQDFDSMDKLVGVVAVMEKAMNPPKPETKTEEIVNGR